MALDGYPNRDGSTGRVMTGGEVRARLTQGNIAKPRLRAQADGTFEIVGVSAETFFGPQQPVRPLAQDPAMGAIGRQFAYPAGYNLNYVPRSNLAVSFGELRTLAMNHDITRMCIETRKDQLAALDWSIKFADPKKEADDDCRKIQDFLQYPDRKNDYATWMRPLLDDMFVCDALTIYPQMTNGGDVYSLEFMDGTTITPLIDATGRTPLPPSPAYEQVNYGVVAAMYQREELIYRPRNLLTWRVFGLPQVEQIIVSVNTALRRQAFVLDYYTQGSIPDALISVPESWNPSQIVEAQQLWDALFDNTSGRNNAQRRKLKFVPPGSITYSKEMMLKDAFDEWLARIVCYCFSLEPTPFIAQVNRATAGTAREQSLAEGLGPLKKFWCSLMNYVIRVYFKRPDIVFVFEEEDSVAPLEQAQVLQIYTGSDIMTVDEAREKIGFQPMTDEQKAAAAPPAPAPGAPANNAPAANAPADNAPSGTAPEPNAAAEKLAKFAGERQAVRIQRQRLTRSVKRALKTQAAMIAAQLATHLGKSSASTLRKDEPSLPSDWESWFDWDAIFGVLPPAVSDPITKTAADGVATGFARLPSSVAGGVTLAPGFANTYAADYAKDRGAEMIGKRYDDAGNLVDNPKAEWRITDETREGVRKMLAQGIADGWTLDDFTANLASDYAFSPARAELIARTETRLADSRGQVAAWQESGVVAKKEWLFSDDGPCDDCQENADAGPIDIDDDFPSGDDAPPLHPNCRCVVAPVVEGL